MNLEHLRLFVRVAAMQNITQAGQALGLSPAVASAQLKKLEDALGVRLVHRTTRKVSLTEDGRAFLPHAENVLSSVEAAEASVGAGGSVPSGTLRVSAPASFGRMHLMPALKSFLTRYPNLILDLRLSDSIVDLVEGGFDVAIRNASLVDSSLIARKLAPDRRLLCASPDYLAKYGEPSNPEELNQHRCIYLSGLEDWQFQTPDGPVTVRTEARFRADNGEAVRDACVQGLGITINSSWSAYQHLVDGSLVQIMPENPLLPETALWAVFPSSRLLAPKVRAFIDHCLDCFGDTPYWDRQLEA